MKILLAGPFSQHVMTKFSNTLPEHEFFHVQNQKEYDDTQDCELIVVRVLQTTAETLSVKKQLKAVIRWGVGYDSVNIKAAGAQGILVSNTPGVNAYAVSELAVGLMIAVGRKLSLYDRATHEGIWDNDQFAKQATSLNHKTVGIVGAGSIGRRVAQQVKCFGADVIYYDMFRLPEETERQCGIKYLPLTELLEQADVLSLHVPLLDSTHHIIGKAELAHMKKDAIVINTARGGLIDDSALAAALAAGELAGAGLDCVENESLSAGPFAGLKNVVITPHIGGTSNDLAEEMVPVIARQIKSFAADKTLEHVVNRAYMQ